MTKSRRTMGSKEKTRKPLHPVRETELGAFVRERRQAHRMSLRELADLAGVGVRFLLEVEHGKPTLRLDRVNAVLAVFGKRLGVVELERE